MLSGERGDSDSQKHESALLHTYVLNKFLTADRSRNVWFRELATLLTSYKVGFT